MNQEYCRIKQLLRYFNTVIMYRNIIVILPCMPAL